MIQHFNSPFITNTVATKHFLSCGDNLKARDTVTWIKIQSQLEKENIEFRNGCFTMTDGTGLKAGWGSNGKTWWGWRIWEKAALKKEVLSYLMSQPYSNDKEFCIVRCVICTLQCTTQSAYSPSQLLMCRRVKTVKAERGSWVECLRLRVFKSLSTSHATAMCMLQYTCRAWEYWGERTRGMASRHGGGAHRGRDRLSNRKSFPAAGAQTKRLIS